MRTSVKTFGKAVSHAMLGPGGYTRISYKLRLAIKSFIIKLTRSLGLKRSGGSGRAEFAPEYNVVDAGTERFYGSNNAHRDLRRDVHRLEKGMTARNRRELFGLEPCAGIITALERETCCDKSTLTWANSVLSRYFIDLAEAQNSTLNDLRTRFNCLKKNGVFEDVAQRLYTPYPPDGIGSASLEGLIESRRSVRRFSSRPVDRKALEDALRMSVHAPTACNRLPYRFILLDIRKKIEDVGALAGGTTGWLDNIPCLVVVVGDWSPFADANDRHTPFIDSSYAVIQFLLKLHKDGMGGCIINWKNSSENDQKLRQFVTLAPWEHAITLVAVGHPETADVPISMKKDCDAILSWNS